jgi:hypothetical protein
MYANDLRRSLLGGVLASALLAPVLAHAQPGTSSSALGSPATPRVVLVEVDGEPGDTEAFVTSFGELSGRLGLRLSHNGAGEHPFARVYIQVRTQARVTVHDGRNEARLSRNVPSARPSSVVIEELAHIAYDAVEALVQEAESDKLLSAPTKKEPGPSVSPAAVPMAAVGATRTTLATGVNLDLGAFAQVHGQGSGDPIGGAGGIMAGVALAHSAWRPELWLALAYHIPVAASLPLVDLKVHTVAARAVPTVRLLDGRFGFVEVGPVLGIDLRVASVASRSVPAERLMVPPTQASLLLGLRAVAHLKIREGVQVFLGLGAELDAQPMRYVIRTGSTRADVFEFSRGRPMALAGFCFSLARRPPDAGLP